MLDALREDGAKVVSFDITFEKPDQTAAPVRALWAKLERDAKSGHPPDPKLEEQVREIARDRLWNSLSTSSKVSSVWPSIIVAMAASV